MHSPETVAFEITFGSKKKKNGSYRDPFITIWHHDPETDGSDDSCGFFMRDRHGDPEMKKKIKDAIDFNFDRVFLSGKNTFYMGYFMPKSGQPNFSVQGIVLNMFNDAAWQFFKFNRKKHTKWMKDNLFDIMMFAENPADSMRDEIIGTFRIPHKDPWNRERQLDHFTSIIYAWIMRSARPWYKHPRWHIRHWRIQFHPFRNLKRRYWDKCSICGKRGFKGSAHSDWNGTKIWHGECDGSVAAVGSLK